MSIRISFDNMPVELLDNIGSFLDQGNHVSERYVNKFIYLNKKFHEIYKDKTDCVKNVLIIKSLVRSSLLFDSDNCDDRYINFLLDPVVGPLTTHDNRIIMEYALAKRDIKIIKKVLDSKCLDLTTRNITIRQAIKNNYLDILSMLIIPDKAVKSSALNSAAFFGTKEAIDIVMENSDDTGISILARHNIFWRLKFSKRVLPLEDRRYIAESFILDSKIATVIVVIEIIAAHVFNYYVFNRLGFI